MITHARIFSHDVVSRWVFVFCVFLCSGFLFCSCLVTFCFILLDPDLLSISVGLQLSYHTWFLLPIVTCAADFTIISLLYLLLVFRCSLSDHFML